MTTENASPVASESPQPAGASPETQALNAAIDAEDGANNDEPAGDKPKSEEQPKPEKTPEERDRIRLQRRNERLLQQRAELRARLAATETQQVASTRGGDSDKTAPSHSDNETLQLSRKELQELIDQEARKLAPSIKQQEAQVEKRRAVVDGLAKELGSEKFDALASDLDDAFDGLTDANGRPKPAADAIFESDDPKALIEYLADPEHADEAEAIGRMSALQAGRAIGKLETKLAAKKAANKPQPSKASAPIEDIRGQGAVPKSLFDLSDRDFIKRRRQQIANRR